MRRIRGAVMRLVDELHVLAALHVAALVGLVAALASELAHTDGIQKAVIGFVVTVAVRQVGDLSERRGRASCMRTAAMNARAILNRRIDVEIDERFPAGNFLIVRELAAARDAGELGALIYPGRRCGALAEQVAEMRSGLMTELGTCYPKLRSSAQRRIDALTLALADLTVHAFALSWSDPEGPHEATRYAELLDALRKTVAAGDDVDRHCDPEGAAAAAARRTAAIAAVQARDRECRAVLIANVRGAIAPLVDAPPERLLDELRQAVDRTRHVDGPAFRDASEDVRAAHRKVTEDLARAIELLGELEKDRTAERAEELRLAIAQIRIDAGVLEALKEA